jgi:protocatechuate 3,4-dioxygenase beta subunit
VTTDPAATTGTLLVRVVYADDGTPAADVVVEVWHSGTDEPLEKPRWSPTGRRRRRADRAHGRVRGRIDVAPGLLPGTYRVEATKDGCRGEAVVEVPAAQPVVVTVTLRRQ